MPNLANAEHQVMLNMCARIHELTPQEKALLTSVYLRAEKAANGTHMGESDVYSHSVLPLEDGNISSALHIPSGLGATLVKNGGSTKVQFFRRLDTDTMDDGTVEAFQTAHTMCQELALAEQYPDVRTKPESHVCTVHNLADGRKYLLATNPKNGITASRLVTSGDDESHVQVDMFQMWNTENFEERTSTIQVQYWSLIRPEHLTQPAQTPA